MKYAYCSSKECNYIQEYGVDREKKISIVAEKFCGKCGAPMLASCPNCNAPRIKKDVDFCTTCGKPYK